MTLSNRCSSGRIFGRKAEGEAPIGLRYCARFRPWDFSAAQSAAAGILARLWQARLLSQCSRHLPGLVERGRLDGVGNTLRQNGRYEASCYSEGTHTSDIAGLLRTVLKRWGVPISITIDRWRQADLRESLIAIDFPYVPIVVRGQGFQATGPKTFD